MAEDKQQTFVAKEDDQLNVQGDLTVLN